MTTNRVFLTGDLTFKSLKPCDLSACTKQEIKDYFINSYELNESLFTSLKDSDSLYLCPDKLRLPLVFYYGHTACVYLNKLVLAGLLNPAERVNFKFESTLETGVDEMTWDDTENYRTGGRLDWPSIEEIVDYRLKVKELILKIIEDTPLELPVTKDSPWWGLFMGFEHERIHIETSSVLLRQMPEDYVSKPEGFVYGPMKYGEPVKTNPMIQCESTNVSLGKPYDFPSYGWDNEYGSFNCRVPEFEASKYMVTNRQYVDFVREGGYGKREFWTDEGWEWIKYKKAKHPSFWVCEEECKSGCGGEISHYTHCKPENHLITGVNAYCNGHSTVDDNGHQGKDEGGGQQAQYRYRAMFDVISMPWDWPAEVNYHEAKAFCTWKGNGYRLPLEAEHHVMRGPQKPASEGSSSDIIYQDDIKANLNLNYGSSTPVNMYSATGDGFHDVHGNAWEWVEDHFNGLPGTTTDYLYEDFSTPCFDGKHNVILGGSWISTGDEASRFARFAFRRHFFQHAGFRLARSVGNQKSKKLPVRLVKDQVYVFGHGIIDNPIVLHQEGIQGVMVHTTNKQYRYEEDCMLDKQLAIEYPAGEASSAVEVAQLVQNVVNKFKINITRMAHIGCGAGKTTFELAKLLDMEQLLGIDFCARFIETCQLLQKGDSISYENDSENHQAQIVEPVAEPKLVFKQLTWLPNEVGHFDLILLSHLDRVNNVKAWLARQREILNKQGMLVICSQKWGREDIGPLIGHRFVTLECYEIEQGYNTLKLTIWKHK